MHWLSGHEKLERSLSVVDWSTIYNTGDVDIAATMLLNTWRHSIQSSTSTVICRRTRMRRITPWITEGLPTAIKNGNNLGRLLASQLFNSELRRRFWTYRNLIVTMTRKAERDYYASQLENTERDPRKLWNVVNSIASRSTRRNGTCPYIDEIMKNDGCTMEVAVQKASQKFNEYFRTGISKFH